MSGLGHKLRMKLAANLSPGGSYVDPASIPSYGNYYGQDEVGELPGQTLGAANRRNEAIIARQQYMAKQRQQQYQNQPRGRVSEPVPKPYQTTTAQPVRPTRAMPVADAEGTPNVQPDSRQLYSGPVQTWPNWYNRIMQGKAAPAAGTVADRAKPVVAPAKTAPAVEPAPPVATSAVSPPRETATPQVQQDAGHKNVDYWAKSRAEVDAADKVIAQNYGYSGGQLDPNSIDNIVKRTEQYDNRNPTLKMTEDVAESRERILDPVRQRRLEQAEQVAWNRKKEYAGGSSGAWSGLLAPAWAAAQVPYNLARAVPTVANGAANTPSAIGNALSSSTAKPAPAPAPAPAPVVKTGSAVKRKLAQVAQAPLMDDELTPKPPVAPAPVAPKPAPIPPKPAPVGQTQAQMAAAKGQAAFNAANAKRRLDGAADVKQQPKGTLNQGTDFVSKATRIGSMIPGIAPIAATVGNTVKATGLAPMVNKGVNSVVSGAKQVANDVAESAKNPENWDWKMVGPALMKQFGPAAISWLMQRMQQGDPNAAAQLEQMKQMNANQQQMMRYMAGRGGSGAYNGYQPMNYGRPRNLNDEAVGSVRA